jgi:hypothetical protein
MANYWSIIELLNIYLDVATPLWAKCEGEAHTPKSGKLESFETLENLEFDRKGQISSHLSVLGLIGKSWSVNVQNDLTWAIWTFVAQVMGKRRAGSQTDSLIPDH